MTEATDAARRPPVNERRIEAGKPPANAIWLWGQGKAPSVPTVRRDPPPEGRDHLGGRPGAGRGRAGRLDPHRRAGGDRLPRHRLRGQRARTRWRRSKTTTSSAFTSRRPTRPATRDAARPRSRPSSGSTVMSSARSARLWQLRSMANLDFSRPFNPAAARAPTTALRLPGRWLVPACPRRGNPTMRRLHAPPADLSLKPAIG